MPGVRLLLHAVVGGLADAQALPGQGRDPVRARPAASSAWCAPRVAAGFDQVIGFDMGGTSTDVAHYAGEFERAFETAGRRRAHARADDGDPHRRGRRRLDPRASTARAFASGRESAGANPGPACYRRGGPLTVTDANVDARQDPAGVLPARVRAAAATSRSTRDVVAQRFAALAARDRARRPARAIAPEAVAEGFVDIAVGSMANAIKKISVARGYDVTRYTLQCFGGAGGQHACLVADALGMTRVFIHPLRRRAVGLRHGPGRPDRDARAGGRAAARRRRAAAAARSGSTRSAAAARARAGERRASAPARITRAARACTCATRAPTRRWSCRSATLAGDRARRSRRRYRAALRLPDAERAADRRGGVGRGGRRRRRAGRDRATRSPRRRRRRAAATRAHVQRRPLARRRAGRCATTLRPGDAIAGPGDHRRDATRRPSSSRAGAARVTALDHLRARAARRRARRAAPIGTTVDPVLLEVFNNLFMNIAEQMGAAAAEHRLLGEHQGAARLLLRAVRRRRQPDRQRAAHAGAPGLDGRDRSRR